MSTTPHGPWPPQHRSWCYEPSCNFRPELSREGVHYGDRATLLPTAGLAHLRLMEIIDEEQRGPQVLLTVVEHQLPDEDTIASVELDVDEAVELAGMLQRHAASVIAARAES